MRPSWRSPRTGLSGFQPDPFGEIAARAGARRRRRDRAHRRDAASRNDPPRPPDVDRRRTSRSGALVAWQVAPERLDAAFDYMFREDPFSGHVVIRTTDAATPGSTYRLWTTLKVPQGYSLREARRVLARAGRRDALPPDAGQDAVRARRRPRAPPRARTRARAPTSRPSRNDTKIVELAELEWRVLVALKREFAPEELRARSLARARRRSRRVVRGIRRASPSRSNARRVIGRFSTFLEHVKATANDERVTRYNALFHWAVPPGREIDAGREVGRHYVITHAYWREGGPEFHDVNVMAVAHGMDKDAVLAHKAAIDEHLREAGIDLPTPTCSGAAAARSSRPRSRRARMPSFAARTASIRTACSPNPAKRSSV